MKEAKMITEGQGETSVLSAEVVKFHYLLLKEPHIIQVRAAESPTSPD